jgi:hypothetical protein
MEDKKEKVVKTPIFVVAPKDRKIAIGEISLSPTDNGVKTIIVKPKKKGKTKGFIKSELNNDYYEFKLVNLITLLMERDFIEEALKLIWFKFFELSVLEKQMLTLNILEATSQYDIPSNLLPESYYDFLVSDDSNDIFF